MVVVAGLVGAVFAAWRVDARLGFSWAVALAALVGFDVVGGAVCNATQTTKRWYARGHNSPRAKLGFVLPHLGYVALVAWLWRGTTSFDTAYFAVFSVILTTGSLAMLATPARLAAPMAFSVFLFALTAIVVSMGLTPGLEWFAPGLLLKLLVGHLVPPQASA
jgi:hypothetical protein